MTKQDEFPNVPTANPTFYRSYSRRVGDSGRETWLDCVERSIRGLKEIGCLEESDEDLIRDKMMKFHCLPPGRWLWVGGTDWLEKEGNFYGAFNCTGVNLNSFKTFGDLMLFAMEGCGTGANLEKHFINQLPEVKNQIFVGFPNDYGEIGALYKESEKKEDTELIRLGENSFYLVVGDSKEGWVDAYQWLFSLSTYELKTDSLFLEVDLRYVRPGGHRLKGFGGTSNPYKLLGLFRKVSRILREAQGRKLNALEISLLIDEAAMVVVAGNIRRTAGIRQFSSDAPLYKMDLWQQGKDGKWRIDPERDALRMANHTRVYHAKPSQDECIEAVRNQFYSGEGAIQYAPEAIARGNADILGEPEIKQEFLELYNSFGAEEVKDWLRTNYPQMSEKEIEHRLQRYSLNPCGEIVGSDFFCNLSEVHLNEISPWDYQSQKEAFEAAAIIAAALLNRGFDIYRYQESREFDPIVGVSFTGLFDFFVNAFGLDWLLWWKDGRPDDERGLKFKTKEREYLTWWKSIVRDRIYSFCERLGLKKPNRYTTVQPSGTKSLLTGASPGWHPPKAARFIRRMTFSREDPVAMACIDYGYTVVPAQSEQDENGNLLDDPYDPRCKEWLVEMPVAVSWADVIDEADESIDVNNFSALAQFDFYQVVQGSWTTHNTSATIELQEEEIGDLGKAIYHSIEQSQGYISAALMPRFDPSNSCFPRLPFEPISKEAYNSLMVQVQDSRRFSDFHEALNLHDSSLSTITGPSGCDSEKCLF